MDVGLIRLYRLQAVLAQFDDQDESLSRGIVISDDEEVSSPIACMVRLWIDGCLG